MDAVEKKLYYMALGAKSKKEIATCTIERETFSVTINKTSYYHVRFFLISLIQFMLMKTLKNKQNLVIFK